MVMANRGQHVLQVVFALELNIGAAEHGLLLPVLAKNNLVALEESAVLHALLAAEPEQRTFDLVFQRNASWIVGIQHRKVGRCLLLKDPRLRATYAWNV